MSFWKDARHSAVRFFLYAFFVGLLPIGIAITLAFVMPHWPSSYITVVMTVLILAGFVGMYFFYDRGVLTRKQRAIRDHLQSKQQAGDALAVQYEEDLAATDIVVLQRRRWLYIAGLCVVLFLVAVIALSVIQTYWSGILRAITQALVMLIALTGCAWIVLGYGSHLNREIKSGKKTVIRGVVTRKFVDHQEDGPDHYFVEMGDINVKVRHYLFKSYEVGDAIEIEVFRKWGDVLLSEKRVN